MKVSGFSFVRNAIKYNYPIVESLLSLAPLCTEVIIALGNSEDGTEVLINELQNQIPHLKIIPSIWDDHLRQGGQVLAHETNKAFNHISKDSDWAIYLQADEVLHEKDYLTIQSEMQNYLTTPKVEGLLFKYYHFYGSYDYIGTSRKWYRREIRIIRNNNNIFSYKDAQGFRVKLPPNKNRKLNVKLIDAHIYHYGWVKRPDLQKQKFNDFQKLWHSGESLHQRLINDPEYNYHKIQGLERFKHSHPRVMQNRIHQQDWLFEYSQNTTQQKLKDQLLNYYEKLTGYRLGEYKNYNLI